MVSRIWVKTSGGLYYGNFVNIFLNFGRTQKTRSKFTHITREIFSWAVFLQPRRKTAQRGLHTSSPGRGSNVLKGRRHVQNHSPKFQADSANPFTTFHIVQIAIVFFVSV